ncbi:MAG: outer membrane beta-barrel protein [Bacteroidales bacterium]
MKRIVLTLIIALSLILPSRAQEKEEKVKALEDLEQKAEATAPQDAAMPVEVDTVIAVEEDVVIPVEADTLIAVEEDIDIPDEEIYAGDTSRVKIGDIVIVEDTGDETVIRIGHKGIRINEDGDDTEINFEEYSDDRDKDRFKGHLGGIEFGFNGYSSDKWNTFVDPANADYNLNTAKSNSFNLVTPSVNLGFSPHFGLVAALGLNWNEYYFDNAITIATDAEGVVHAVPITDPVDKSKLLTTYATLPVMLEAQIPVSHNKTINIGAGVIGAIKLGSHTKVKYDMEGNHKDKIRDDFSLNLLRWGATARVGYEMFQVYGTWYLSPMFEQGRGPELYPFEVGIALSFND